MAETRYIEMEADTRANLGTNLKALTRGVETDNGEDFVYKDNGGVYHISASQKSTGVSGNNTFGAITCDSLTVATGGSITITDLVEGELVFGNSDGSMGQDAGMFWDNTNKRLGIGNATPAYILDLMISDSATAIPAGTDILIEKDGNIKLSFVGGTVTLVCGTKHIVSGTGTAWSMSLDDATGFIVATDTGNNGGMTLVGGSDDSAGLNCKMSSRVAGASSYFEQTASDGACAVLKLKQADDDVELLDLTACVQGSGKTIDSSAIGTYARRIKITFESGEGPVTGYIPIYT